MKKLLAAFSVCLPMLFPQVSQAKIITEQVDYTIDGEIFSGFLAFDDQYKKRPGILVVHEWWGHNDYARQRAEQLAEAGYTAFAIDMYGKGKLAKHPDGAKAFMQEATKSLAVSEKRFKKAYDYLNSHQRTEAGDIAAIGYCFGGGVVLHMARVGMPLKAAISFHGNLTSMLPSGQKPAVEGIVQVFTGGKDPMIPIDQVTGFTAEMFEAGADFAVQVYPDAVHSFTNPGSTAVGQQYKMPLAYDAFADYDSWQQTLDLLQRTFTND